MQFTTATLLSIVVALAAAAPAPQLPVAGDREFFSLIAINSGSAVQNSPISAAKRSLLAGFADQGASCEKEGQTSATFFLADGGLFLNTGSAEPQQIWVDRSGMGQGVIGYTTGAQTPPRNAERQGWSFAQGNLIFNGSGLIACPNSINGAWSIWAPAGITNPAGNSDCVTINARALQVTEPVACVYTQ